MKDKKFKSGMTVIRSVMGEEEPRQVKSVRKGVVSLYSDDGSDEADHITYDENGREIGGRGGSRIRIPTEEE